MERKDSLRFGWRVLTEFFAFFVYRRIGYADSTSEGRAGKGDTAGSED